MTPNRITKYDTRILVVSFGTSNHDTREKTIGAVERAIAAAFPDIPVRRAFTSSFIIRKLKQTEGLEIDNVADAILRAHNEGVRNLVIQPTHIMKGHEYEKVQEAVKKAEHLFDRISFGMPLLSDDTDLDALVSALSEETKESVEPDMAHVFMGHGSDAEANEVYARLQERLAERGFGNIYIATVEGEPTITDVKQMLDKEICRTVVLQPLMVVAGDHAVNDMAGDGDSWKTMLEDAGFTVSCVLKGIGELPAVQKIYVDHVRKAFGVLWE